jgi:hypothetical protein
MPEAPSNQAPNPAQQQGAVDVENLAERVYQLMLKDARVLKNRGQRTANIRPKQR